MGPNVNPRASLSAPFRMNSISDAIIESDQSSTLEWPKPSIPPPEKAQDPIDYLPLILNARVYDVSIETPFQFARKLSSRLKSTCYLKREDLQPIFSFKCRGAFNKIYNLTREEKMRGVCCVSAGNHAQGVALASQKLGIKATIVMPTFAPEIKVENVRRLGARVILFGNDFDMAKKECLQIAARENLVFVPPFDDPLVIAGQGTVGIEILKQIRHTRLDAIFVCVGGGGLISGIAAYVKRVRPEIKIIGVNTVDSDSMFQSLHKGSPVELEKAGMFSDGTSIKLVGSHCVKICKQYVDDMVKVNNDEICAAIKDTYEETRSILEPAGALGIAGMKKYIAMNPQLMGGVFCAVSSGANMSFDRLRFVAERASVGEGKEILLSVLIPERPGSLLALHDQIFPRNITELSYRYSDAKEAHVFLGFHVGDRKEVDSVMKSVKESIGVEVLNITDNIMASQHVRYMSGGRAASQTDEYIFRITMPEKAGSLKELFSALQEDWNISLFHYRNHGSDYGRILIGIQIKNRTDAMMEAFFTKLKVAGSRECVEETENPVSKYFFKI